MREGLANVSSQACNVTKEFPEHRGPHRDNARDIINQGPGTTPPGIHQASFAFYCEGKFPEPELKTYHCGACLGQFGKPVSVDGVDKQAVSGSTAHFYTGDYYVAPGGFA